VRDSNAEFEQWYKANGEGEADVEPRGATTTFAVLYKGRAAHPFGPPDFRGCPTLSRWVRKGGCWTLFSQAAERRTFPFDQVPMHVAQLFDVLALRPDFEIVEAALPDFSRCLRPQRTRPICCALRHRLTEGVVSCGSLMRRWKCFGHDDMADDEVMALPDFFQQSEEQVAMAGGFEQLPTVF
jgi:hypothetical protein